MKQYLTIAKCIEASIWLAKNWYKIWEKTLRIIGDIKVFKTPCWINYNPEEFDYNVRGEDICKIQEVIQPGDIILRSYENYLDSYLIPGKYSHSGVYIGDGKIIHAVAEGVKEIHLIDFCQADGILVLRHCADKEKQINRCKKWIGKEYDFKFNSTDSTAFYCHELTATSLKDMIDVEAVTPTFMGMKLKFLKAKYLAESFINNSNFEKVIEI
jgi:hypothetical protein